MSTPWQRVRDQLINDGAMTEQGVTRTPKPRHCRDCGRAVIAAIDANGFEVAVEPTPTTPAGELGVLLAGGRTYALIYGAMHYRTARRIEYQDANNETVHAMHECGKAPPETHPAYLAKKERGNALANEKPPF